MFELSREVIGALALGLFWLHILLIAGAAWIDARTLGQSVRGRVGAGVVRTGQGPDGALARHVVEQIGRSKGDGVVHFNDAGHRSEVFGGVIELDDGRELAIAASSEIAVWPDARAQARAAEAGSAEVVAAAACEARRARGFSRTVAVTIGAGERVFVVEREGRVGIVASRDPSRFLAGKLALVAGFVVAELALAGACTVASLWPPLFGTVSMIGAAAALGMFLGVQPIGVAVRDALRTPDRAYLRGRWGGG